jgi:hypothetical protein
MSTLKADGIEAATGTNTDLTLAGKGTGVPDLAAGFKVGSVAGVPTASIQASAVTTAKINDDAVTTAKIVNDAVTLAKLAAGTDGELITWDASGDPAAVAVGTATHVLTSNGAGAAPTFQAAGGGAWTEISHTNISGDPTYVEVTGLTPTYECHVLVCTDVKPGTDNVTVNGVQMGDSGAYETADVYYSLRQNKKSGGTSYDAVIAEAVGAWTVCEGQGNATGEGFCAIIYIWGSEGVGYPRIYGEFSGVHVTAGFFGSTFNGIVSTVQTVTRFRMKFASGTIASGQYTLYGIKHS